MQSLYDSHTKKIIQQKFAIFPKKISLSLNMYTNISAQSAVKYADWISAEE